MIAAVGLGLGTIFVAYPVLQTILKYAGAAYLIYLAVRSRCPAGHAVSGNRRRSDDFLGRGDVPVDQRQGWVMVIGTITAYAASQASPGTSHTDRISP